MGEKLAWWRSLPVVRDHTAAYYFTMELWQCLCPLFAQAERLQAFSLGGSPLGESAHIFAPYSSVGPIAINCLRIPFKAKDYFITVH